MKTRQESKIRNRKMVVALMEYIITLGCLLVAFVMVSGKSIKQTSSYARPEEVSRYQVVEDRYLTRVRPLTEYETFKEIAERTLNRGIKIYTDETKEEEVVEGIITSGMIVETENNGAIAVPTENTSYEVRVIGDLNKDGDCNVTELTKIIREIVGLERIGNRGEEISGDFNGDGEINVVDVTMCINYIVYGEIEPDKEEPNAPEIKVIEPEEKENNWYNSDVRVEIVEKERKEGEIEKTETIIEKQLVGSEAVEKETTTEKEIDITEEGEYKITTQSYGVNRLKSEVVTKEINIDKTTPELKISREEVDRAQCKIVIKASDKGGIRKYSIVRDGEEERSKEGIDKKEINGYVTIRENGRYKVVVEDKAGNEAEEQIEINNLNNRYIVIFKNEDGSIISQREYTNGETITTPQNPGKAEDNTYTYEFAGWSPEVEETVIEDKEYTATYTPVYKNYTVTFKDEDGKILTEKTDYHYGETITIPENPSKAEDNTNTYRFIGWDKEVSTVVEGNVEYKAVYEAKKKGYTVRFKDEEGRILTEKTDYHYGERVAIPQNPGKAEDNTYTYEFAGWSPEVEETVIEDKEYTATYTPVYKNYTVTFKDEEGRIILTKTDYHYGDNVTVPENPSKAEDNTNTYRFIGWDKEVSTVVEGNVEYKAVYEATRKDYTITFKDENGDVLSNKTDYHYGERVAIPQNPVKSDDETYTYEFAGWSPEVEETVIENKEYTATYTPVYKNYTVTFKDEDGRVILAKTDYHYGDNVTVPENPSKAEDNTNTYRFIGWDKEVSTVVEGNVEYKAVYEATRKEYTITFKDENETVLTEKIDYRYGDTVAVPQNPSKQEDETYTYEFVGWKTTNEQGQEIIVTSEEIGNVLVGGNKEYIAIYRSVYKNYAVTFKDEDGRVILTKTDYHYGDTITIPENPSKAEDNTFTYEFKGWGPEVQETVIENKEYTATYEAKYKEYTVTFKQDSGEILSNLGQHYGDKVRLPEDPHKLSTMEYAYTFTGWNKIEEGQEVAQTKEEIENTDVTKELEYVATYEAAKINYNLVFYNDDYNEETGEGTVIERRTYNYGDIINFPEATKEDTEEIKYVFDNWKNLGTREISETEIDIEFKAEYREEYYVARIEPIVQTVSITNEETGETTTEEQIILEGRSYLTLKEAIEEAGRVERTIRMLKDTEESVTIEDDQNITINLNGKTITAKKTYVIKTYGELTIVNNSDNEGKILEISEEDIGYGIYNRDGKVTIKSGTIAAEARGENAEAYAIYNQSESPLAITGGSIIAEAKGINSIGAGIYNLSGEEIDVTGGLVYGNAIGEGTTTYGIYNETEGRINVTEGIIQANTSFDSAVSYGIYNKAGEEVTFNGGEIKVQSDKSKSYGIYNEYGKVTIGKIETIIQDEVEIEKEEFGTINIEGSEGYGIYNDKGIIEENAIKITAIVTTAYGIYNNEGTIYANKGTITSTSANLYGIYNNAGKINILNQTIESSGTKSYGIYNKSEINIDDIKINNKNSASNTYGIYNEANKDIVIQNIEVTGGENGICSTEGNITINEAIITSAQGIYTVDNKYNNPVIILKNANIESSRYGIYSNVGTVILKEVTINSNGYGIYTTGRGNIEIGTKNGSIDTEKTYIYGKSYAVYINTESLGSIKFYDGILQGQNAIYGGISDIEINSKIKIETIDNNGKSEEIAILQITEIEETNVAKIGEITYLTLADAVNAVPENQTQFTTIEIIKDSDISNVVEISSKKNIKLDLKGYTLTTYAKGGIINNGTLEIIDTLEENNEQQEPTQGNSTIKALKESNFNKTLKLAENETGGEIESQAASIGIIESKIGIGITNNGILLLTNGKIVSNNCGISNSKSKSSQVTVQGAIIEAKSTGISSGAWTERGTVYVKSGLVKSNGTGISIYTGHAYISGGEIEGKSTGISGGYGILYLSGGNIKSENYGLDGLWYIYISGGEIEGKCGIRNNANDLQMSGGRIKATDDGIDSRLGTIKITGGEIFAGKTAVKLDGSRVGSLVIGEKENEFENNPIIVGKEYGIQECDYEMCYISYYNGIIKGKEEAIYGSITNTREGKDVVENIEIIEGEEYKVTSLVDERIYDEPIAQIGENTYTTVSSLKSAISEIPTNLDNVTEVKILNDFELLKTITVLNGQKVLLDLNGKTITSTLAIYNQGELEITDNTEEHLGKIIGTKLTTIKAGGTTKITKGTIEGKQYTILPIKSPTIIIGTKDGNVDENQVLLKSDTGNVIYSRISGGGYERNVKIYDGKIIALRTTIDKTYIKDIEEGYKIVTNKVDGMNVTNLQLEDPVAKIGETGYYNLQTAINECDKGQTIEVFRTIDNLKNTLIIQEEKEIKIDLKNYDIRNSNLDKIIVNNGTLTIENGNGTISNSKTDGIAIENNGIINLNAGGVHGQKSGIQNNGIINIDGGIASGNMYAIENLEYGKINIISGTVRSYNYGIYNESNEDINIIGGTININNLYSSRLVCGIYNNADARIDIAGGTINSYNYSISETYMYGIYNKGNGEIDIGEQGKIELANTRYNYGIYNMENGNITTEGIISVNGEYLSYGIRNSGQGQINVTGGNITSTSTEGTSYGIENGAFGELEVTGGNIIANTTTGTAYGIKNISTKTVKIKEGNIKATGEESYGIYSNSADIEIGVNDDVVKPDTPIIEGNKEGVHVNTTDTKFKFYDGKIIGKLATNVGVNIPEYAKIIRHYNEETQLETLIIMDKDTYIITFYSDEEKTQIIEQKLFKSTDTEIEEPAIPEREGYIGYWSDYEIGEHDIETWICYAIHRENGTKLKATDENGLTWNYTYNNGEATDVYYESGDIESLDGIVNIPARLDGYSVVNLFNSSGGNFVNIFSESNYEENTTVKQINIPNGVKTIGNSAFINCKELTNIDMSNVVNIGNSSFYGCDSLTEIDMPNVTSIGRSTFEQCRGLTSINMPNAINIGYRAFLSCFNLVSVDMPNVTYLGKIAFNNCNNLKSFTATKLTLIEDGDYYSPSSIYMGLFNNCINLENVKIPNVTTIGTYAFSECKGLKKIYMPKVKSIRYRAFYRCRSLEEIKIPDSATDISNTSFSYCNSLKSIFVDSENEVYDSRDNCNAIIKTSSNRLIQGCNNTTIPDSVTSIGDNAFYGCSELIELEIPDSVTSIGINVFVECKSLKKLTIPGTMRDSYYSNFNNVNFEELSITGEGKMNGNIRTMWNKKNNFFKVNIKQGITGIGSAFRDCGRLKSIEIPSSVTKIGDYEFSGCSSLTEVSMPNVTSIGSGAFSNCNYITKITIPITLRVNRYNNPIPSNKLEEIILVGEGEMGYTNESYPWVNAKNTLKKVIIGEGITNIYGVSFWECSSLREINIPSTVTSIGECAFGRCNSLESIKIPSNVTYIADSVFLDWTENQTIYIEAEEQPSGWSSNWNDGCSANIVWGYTGE